MILRPAMTTQAIATAIELAFAQPGTAPDWVHLFPLGDVVATDGRKWRLEGPERVIAASLLDGRSLPIDRDHAADMIEERRGAGTAPAAGWIEKLEARADGVWGLVDWTDRGRAEVAAREYRYLSPVFLVDEGGRVTRILRASLTNIPAITELQALAAAEHPAATGGKMEQVIKALGLKADAAEAAVLAAVHALQKRCDDADTQVKALAAAEPDPAKFVPIAVFQAEQKAHADLKGSLAEEKALAAVDGAIKDGKLQPAAKDWALDYAKKDFAGFTEFMKSTASFFGKVAPGGALDGNGEVVLTEDDKKTARVLGQSEEKFLATKKADHAAKQGAAA